MNDATRLSLLDDLKEGRSDDAWTRFCAVYEHVIRGWLQRAGLQSADVDDVCQESVATVFTEVAKFEHNGRVGAFRCWLRRIVANRLKRAWTEKSEKQRGETRLDFNDLAEQLADDSSRLSIVWDRQHDRIVLAKLLEAMHERFSDAHIQIFQRIAIDQEDARAVANDLGMTLGAVRVAQHRVLKELKLLAGAMLE